MVMLGNTEKYNVSFYKNKVKDKTEITKIATIPLRNKECDHYVPHCQS